MALNLKRRHFLCLKDFTREELEEIIFQAEKLKVDHYAGKDEKFLAGKTILVLFEKPSTRTRISFVAAINQLGGFPEVEQTSNMQLIRGETIPDTAKVLGRYVDAIVARVYAHKTLEELAKYSGVPVINALSDFSHPCQALGDFLTIKEKKGTLKGVKLAYLGDGNNVANSLLIGGSILGLDVAIASPNGYEPMKEVVDIAMNFAKRSGSKILITNNPSEAVKDADVLYTDVWASMGQEEEHDKRVAIFKPYQLNSDIVNKAKEDVIVMHCLPAHRGEEITDEVLDGPHSVVFDQAENRLHIQKAILSLLV